MSCVISGESREISSIGEVAVPENDAPLENVASDVKMLRRLQKGCIIFPGDASSHGGDATIGGSDATKVALLRLRKSCCVNSSFGAVSGAELTHLEWVLRRRIDTMRHLWIGCNAFGDAAASRWYVASHSLGLRRLLLAASKGSASRHLGGRRQHRSRIGARSTKRRRSQSRRSPVRSPVQQASAILWLSGSE